MLEYCDCRQLEKVVEYFTLSWTSPAQLTLYRFNQGIIEREFIAIICEGIVYTYRQKWTPIEIPVRALALTKPDNSYRNIFILGEDGLQYDLWGNLDEEPNPVTDFYIPELRQFTEPRFCDKTPSLPTSVIRIDGYGGPHLTIITGVDGNIHAVEYQRWEERPIPELVDQLLYFNSTFVILGRSGTWYWIGFGKLCDFSHGIETEQWTILLEAPGATKVTAENKNIVPSYPALTEPLVN